MMLGISINGPTEVYCDNESVFKNGSVDSSTLTKKHVSICYHRVREAVASGLIVIAWIPNYNNVADLFTKVLSYQDRTKLLSNLVYMGSYDLSQNDTEEK